MCRPCLIGWDNDRKRDLFTVVAAAGYWIGRSGCGAVHGHRTHAWSEWLGAARTWSAAGGWRIGTADVSK